MSDVLVVGAGPVGLTMACELARHGIVCRIVDKAAEPLRFCRAIGVTPRTLEVWEDMGIAQEMIDAGLWITGQRLIIPGRPPVDTTRDLSDLPFATLGLPQYETERLLTRHLARHGIAIERGVALETLEQDPDGVTVRLSGAAAPERFRYVIGCDGAHSAVRRALGIAFEGEAMPMTFMLGDIHMATDLPYGMALMAIRPHEDAAPDLFVAIPLPEPGRFRVSMLAPDGIGEGTGHGLQSEMAGPDLAALQAVADDLLPDRPVLSELRWSSMFRISMRLAAKYREGRVFIAGDAAHIHPPTGGQGMNTGIQDAYNLAWKLAAVTAGRAPPALLDSYEAERRPVGEDVVARTLAASMNLGRGGPKPDRLEDTQLLVNYRGSAWVRDDGGADGPPAGDRAPDAGGLRRHGVGFPLRVFEMLRGTEPVLLLHRPADSDALPRVAGLRVVAVTEAPEADRYGVTLLQDATGDFAAVYGAAAGAWLVRPDGYVAWRGPSADHAGLHDVLARVFGIGGLTSGQGATDTRDN
ncbi:monooxygenase [Roseomonas terrae]|jgi:2-polyprenyl-6-methoxyphenol hydroxylase-like FAD-dependent oxidoreductase|uniref:Monooxygenase n=1 Tax=Neoroseomonas terrae TaxID=424799 RepID=A0ABS5EEE9_9PROT|nr:FAD-dependent monooxygenase [Neoroseomonas terrae]MBR0649388.1 monooxygenase [Neoroseomonas terrae]